jgi:hypothetical protein
MKGPVVTVFERNGRFVIQQKGGDVLGSYTSRVEADVRAREAQRELTKQAAQEATRVSQQPH